MSALCLPLANVNCKYTTWKAHPQLSLPKRKSTKWRMRNESRDSFVLSDTIICNIWTYNTTYESNIEPIQTSYHNNSWTLIIRAKFVVFYRVHGKQTWRPFCASLRRQDIGAPLTMWKCSKIENLSCSDKTYRFFLLFHPSWHLRYCPVDRGIFVQIGQVLAAEDG